MIRSWSETYAAAEACILVSSRLELEKQRGRRRLCLGLVERDRDRVSHNTTIRRPSKVLAAKRKQPQVPHGTSRSKQLGVASFEQRNRLRALIFQLETGRNKCFVTAMMRSLQ